MAENYTNAISNTFPNNIWKEYNYSEEIISAIEKIGKSLTELFNFIEPGLFDKKIIVVKNLSDTSIFPVANNINLTMNKAFLFNYNKEIMIQLFDDGNILLWEDVDSSKIFDCPENIIYLFEANKEKIIAKNKIFDITVRSFGSRYSEEFDELELQLRNYHLHKIKNSSCPIFSESWASDRRIFFKGGGKNIPEEYMQKSLHNFIKDLSIFKGNIGQFEPTREQNVNAQKPVDIIVHWEKSNRMAIIEIKWLGKSVHNGGFKSIHTNSRANDGFKQLKEYFDLAKSDYPHKLIKCYLVIIDARRWQTNEQTTTISFKNGMYYENTEIELNNDRKYHMTYKNIQAPIRMFAEPICDEL